MLTDFQNFFHPWTQQRSYNELIIKGVAFNDHLKGVDTLPREIGNKCLV